MQLQPDCQRTFERVYNIHVCVCVCVHFRIALYVPGRPKGGTGGSVCAGAGGGHRAKKLIPRLFTWSHHVRKELIEPSHYSSTHRITLSHHVRKELIEPIRRFGYVAVVACCGNSRT